MCKIFSVLMIAFSAMFIPLWSGEVKHIEHPAIAAILDELPHYGVLCQIALLLKCFADQNDNRFEQRCKRDKEGKVDG